MHKLEGVEAARGVAALLVVLVHASSMFGGEKYFGSQPLGGLFKFGHAGVDFFFVLSGFIIYYIHNKELGCPEFASSYWRKRFIRLMPVYWVVLAIYGCILVFSPTKDFYERGLGAILTSLFLIPQEHSPILGVAWSLSHEILFYLLFSSLFFSLRIGRFLFLSWGSLIVFNILTGYFQDWFWGGFVFRIFNVEFFFGLFVAHALRRWPIRYPLTFLIVGAGLFLSAGIHESWLSNHPAEWPPRHMAYALGAAMALYGVVGLEYQNRLRLPKLAAMMGEASYSIYLIHVIVLMLLQQGYLLLKRLVSLPDHFVFALALLATVGTGIVFSKLVEQPLLRYFRRLLLPR